MANYKIILIIISMFLIPDKQNLLQTVQIIETYFYMLHQKSDLFFCLTVQYAVPIRIFRDYVKVGVSSLIRHCEGWPQSAA